MSEFQEIWVDMDGVLADFVSAAIKLFQLDAVPEDINHFHAISERLPGGDKQFWNELHDAGPDFWGTLEPYPYAHRLIEECQKAVGEDSVFILTAPTRHPSSCSGKVRWIREHFPDFYKNQRVCLFLHKHLLAKPHRLLIDDYTKNVERWIDEGGWGVLYPRPWNGPTLGEDASFNLVSSAITV